VSAKYFVCFLEITNSTSRIAVIVRNPVSKSTFCLNLTNTIFIGRPIVGQRDSKSNSMNAKAVGDYCCAQLENK
jgi:hypothetical protein